jgi:hypothetical protein
MFDLINDDLDKLAALGHGIEAIEAIAKWSLDGEGRESEALHTIATITDTLRGMFTSKISAQDTEDEIAALKHALIGVIDHKFDGGGL